MDGVKVDEDGIDDDNDCDYHAVDDDDVRQDGVDDDGGGDDGAVVCSSYFDPVLEMWCGQDFSN